MGFCAAGNGIWLSRLLDQLTYLFQVLYASGVGQQPIVADAVKAARQYMDQEAANELIAAQGHGLVAMLFAAVILPFKGNGVTIKAQQAVITDRHPVGVAGQVSQYRLGSGKGTLGIHDPVGLLLFHDPLCKVHRMLQ